MVVADVVVVAACVLHSYMRSKYRPTVRTWLQRNSYITQQLRCHHHYKYNYPN